ncbi:MAG: LysR family transcriptional regulator [Actinoplanes sp.]
MTDFGGAARPDMDAHLKDVRTFVAVAEHLHFSRAADALFISQPALSKRIQDLERLMRVTLFDRDRRTVRLTAAGEALLPGARAVLAAWAAAQTEVAKASEQSRAELVIGISLGVERGLLPAIRGRLADLLPHAELRLRRISWSDQSSGLAPGNNSGVDAAFIWLPLTAPENYRWLSVASEPRWLVLSAEHPLARQREVAFADILDEPFLALPAGAGAAREFWLGADARDGRPAPVSGVAASTEELVELLAAGTGVCLLAQGNLDAVRRDGITAVRVSGLAPSELVLAWRRDDDRPLLRGLVEATRLTVKKLRMGTAGVRIA